MKEIYANGPHNPVPTALIAAMPAALTVRRTVVAVIASIATALQTAKRAVTTAASLTTAATGATEMIRATQGADAMW